MRTEKWLVEYCPTQKQVKVCKLPQRLRTKSKTNKVWIFNTEEEAIKHVDRLKMIFFINKLDLSSNTL